VGRRQDELAAALVVEPDAPPFLDVPQPRRELALLHEDEEQLDVVAHARRRSDRVGPANQSHASGPGAKVRANLTRRRPHRLHFGPAWLDRWQRHDDELAGLERRNLT